MIMMNDSRQDNDDDEGGNMDKGAKKLKE